MDETNSMQARDRPSCDAAEDQSMFLGHYIGKGLLQRTCTCSMTRAKDMIKRTLPDVG